MPLSVRVLNTSSFRSDLAPPSLTWSGESSLSAVSVTPLLSRGGVDYFGGLACFVCRRAAGPRGRLSS